MRLRRKLTTLQPELVAFATSLTADRIEAEDLAHDAVVRALQSGSAPRELGDLRPWMFRVIRNLFIDGKRKARVQREFSADHARLSDIGPANGRDPVETLMVRQAFDQLVPRDRESLI